MAEYKVYLFMQLFEEFRMHRRNDHVNGWTSKFNEGDGKGKITIEKGERSIYRLKYWRGDKEASIPLFCMTPDELADSLVNEGLFNDEEAHLVALQVVS